MQHISEVNKRDSAQMEVHMEMQEKRRKEGGWRLSNLIKMEQLSQQRLLSKRGASNTHRHNSPVALLFSCFPLFSSSFLWLHQFEHNGGERRIT